METGNRLALRAPRKVSGAVLALSDIGTLDRILSDNRHEQNFLSDNRHRGNSYQITAHFKFDGV